MVARAWQVLGDTSLRSQFDSEPDVDPTSRFPQRGPAGGGGDQFRGEMSPEDLFNMFFNGAQFGPNAQFGGGFGGPSGMHQVVRHLFTQRLTHIIMQCSQHHLDPTVSRVQVEDVRQEEKKLPRVDPHCCKCSLSLSFSPSPSSVLSLVSQPSSPPQIPALVSQPLEHSLLSVSLLTTASRTSSTLASSKPIPSTPPSRRIRELPPRREVRPTNYGYTNRGSKMRLWALYARNATLSSSSGSKR